jgi:ADP-ribose pyrophosphatase
VERISGDARGGAISSVIEMLVPEAWASADVLRAVGSPEAAAGEAVGDRRRLRVPEDAARRLAFCLAAFGWLPDDSARGEVWAFRERPEGAAPSPAPEVLAEMAAELASLAGSLPAADAASGLPQFLARALARARGRREEAPRALRATTGEARSERVERPYVGYFALERHALRHRRFDGSMSPPLDRLVFACGDAVTVLPYDPARDRVLLIEQFRAGPFARRDALPWCLEVIAGRCDADEEPEATARREAREEAGLALGRLERVLAYYPTPAVAAEHLTSFVGEADLRDEGGVFGLASEHEDIRAFTVARAEAEAALASGEVNNAPLALSLMWLALNADRLRRLWGGDA